MKVSYYQSKLIDPARHFVVQISNGTPRFGAKPEAKIHDLAPPLELMPAGLSRSEFAKRYLQHLDQVGIEAIQRQLAEVEKLAGNREAVLCCFESLKSPGQICHRQLFAKWFQDQSGLLIPELAQQPELAL